MVVILGVAGSSVVIRLEVIILCVWPSFVPPEWFLSILAEKIEIWFITVFPLIKRIVFFFSRDCLVLNCLVELIVFVCRQL